MLDRTGAGPVQEEKSHGGDFQIQWVSESQGSFLNADTQAQPWVLIQ